MKQTNNHTHKQTIAQKTLNNSEIRQSSQVFKLTDLIKPDFDLWLIVWLLGLITVVSIVGLLMLSGWFLTATALSGILALGSHQFNYLMPAAIIRTMAISRTAGRYGELMVSHHAIFSLLKQLRVKFFAFLAKQPLSKQYKTLQSSQQMHRLVSDIDILNEFNLRVVSAWFLGIMMVLLLTVFIGVYLPNSSTAMMLIIVGLMLFSLLVPAFLTYRGIHTASKLATLSEQRRDALLNPLSILTQLLLWQKWRAKSQHFEQLDESLHQLEWQSQKTRSLLMLLMQYTFYAVMVVVLIAAVLYADQYKTVVNVPVLLAIILGLFGIQEIVVPLGQHYLSLGNAITSKHRLNEMLMQTEDVDSSMQTDANLLALPEGQLTAQLVDLSAKLPNAIVGATNVNVTITSGTPMIITGTSGCGKSTLLQTLANELQPQSGQILLNGLDWQQLDWQNQLGYLGQQLDIFDQTLENNLRLGKADATEQELMDVLDMVALTNWVNMQPQGLQTQLGEYGTSISGGQARRVALARLLLSPKKVLLLDEPFAGLDAQTQSRLWQAVRQQQKDGILIVVSHHHQWDDMGDCDWLELKTDDM